ncbi:MAG: ketoacyl-ACP synthase III [Bacteroidetes bacterium]|nr:ketoacyl-ACP synthase III [Bacteroidota bacterium]
MAQLSFHNVRIAGVSACVPKQIVRNADYEWISEEERRELIKATGVVERRIAPSDVTTVDLCFAAAQQLIDKLEWDKAEVDALVFVSQSGDYLVPASSIILQNRLGLSKDCMAFDVGLGCSGFVYGLSLVSALLESGSIKKALLLAGDKSSISASPTDKSTYPLFGDAGTATALQYHSTASSAFFNLQSDGSGFENIIIPHGGAKHLIDKSSLEVQKIGKGIERRPLDLVMNGADVFDFALREVIPNIRKTLAYSLTRMEDIDYFVLHQANRLMNEMLRKMMKINEEKVPYSIGKFGNTSSASIPLTMVAEMKSDLEQKPLRLLLSGFGVGLSWGTCILHTDKIICVDLIEL